MSDDISRLAYDSVLTVAKSVNYISADFNISDFHPLDTSNLTSVRIGEAIRNTISNITFSGRSVRKTFDDPTRIVHIIIIIV